MSLFRRARLSLILLALALNGAAVVPASATVGTTSDATFAAAVGATGSTALSTRELLRTTTPPGRDEADLMLRFTDSCHAAVPRRVPLFREEAVGERRVFWVLDYNSNRYFEAPATLRHASEHLLFYVQDGVISDQVTNEGLASSAEVFETKTLPILQRYFGDLIERSRVTVFNGRVPGLGGYFSSSDMLPKAANPYSNERPMVFMNLDGNRPRPGSAPYDAVLAHELQHFVHGQVHPQQDSWINEGASELAMTLSGFGSSTPATAYLNNPEIQLTGWAEPQGPSAAHYAAGQLILEYFARRMGGYERVKELIASPGPSLTTFERYFERYAPHMRFDDLFRDFVVANVVNDRAVADGRFGHERVAQRARIQERHVVPSISAGPGALSNVAVRPYATRYVELVPGLSRGELELRFAGGAAAALYGAQPKAGSHQWWGHATDDSVSTLTREVDLTGVARATLKFGAWFSTERDYDYAGVAVSTDGGCAWRTLAGRHTTDTNPVGQNLGHGFTGNSNGWLDEEMDLSPYAGSRILLRFFYVTDQAFHGSGFALDEVSIPEIGLYDGAEAEDETWKAEGFLRSVNAAAVDWAVQAIAYSDSGVQVLPLSVVSEGGPASGTLRIPGFGAGVQRVVVAVSPLVPVTLEPTEYRLEAVVR